MVQGHTILNPRATPASASLRCTRAQKLRATDRTPRSTSAAGWRPRRRTNMPASRRGRSRWRRMREQSWRALPRREPSNRCGVMFVHEHEKGCDDGDCGRRGDRRVGARVGGRFSRAIPVRSTRCGHREPSSGVLGGGNPVATGREDRSTRSEACSPPPSAPRQTSSSRRSCSWAARIRAREHGARVRRQRVRAARQSRAHGGRAGRAALRGIAGLGWRRIVGTSVRPPTMAA
jgi:hypothetical protein